MAKYLNGIEKILQIRSELVLHKFNCDDTIDTFISRLNDNFDIIKEFSGGRQGLPGRPGDSGCAVGFGSFGGNDHLESPFVYGNSFSQCYNLDNLEKRIMLNREGSTKTVISNVVMGNDELRLADENSDELTSTFIPFVSSEYQLSLIHSDKISGEGKHIYLGNSKAMIEDATKAYSCISGFSIENNKIENTNTEMLKFKGIKSNEIDGHLHIINNESDITEFQKSNNNQILRIIPNSINNNYSANFILQEQKKNNDVRIGDYTGWNTVFIDTISTDDFWENDNISVSYILLKNELNKRYTELPLQLDKTKSFIRFKRMNNFVLIDFKIVIIGNNGINPIELKLIRIKNDGDFNLPCSTHQWLSGTALYDESEESEIEFNEFSRFKVFKERNNFDISIKCKIPVTSNGIYHLAGQCIATLEDVNCPSLVLSDEIISMCYGNLING